MKRSQDRNVGAGTEGYLLGHPKDRGRHLLGRGWAGTSDKSALLETMAWGLECPGKLIL